MKIPCLDGDLTLSLTGCLVKLATPQAAEISKLLHNVS